MKLRRNLAAILGCALLITLAVAMVACGEEDEVPEWKHPGVTIPGDTTATAAPGTEGTTVPGESTSDGTASTAPTQKPTPPDPDEPQPSVDIQLGEKEELEDTPTTPTEGGNTQSGNNQTGNNQSGNSQSGNNQSGNNQSGNNQSGNNQSGNTGTNPTYDKDNLLTYEEYEALSGDAQYAYYLSFPSAREFNDWYNAAKKAYQDAQPKETIGPDGNIDLNS